MKRRLWWWAAPAVLLAFSCARCGGGEAKDGGASEGQAKATKPAEPALDAASLSPVLQAVGPEGAVPSHVQVRFARPVARPEWVGKGAGASELSLNPQVEGTLVFTDASTLVFTPKQPFPLSTRFTVELRAVDTRAGVRQPTASGEWMTQFETPPFTFVRLLPDAVDLEKGRVSVDLRFSGPLKVDEAKRFVAVQVDGRPAQRVTIEPHDQDTTLRVKVQDGRLTVRSRLDVTVRAGLPAADGSPAAAAQASLDLFSGKPMEVRYAVLTEGPSGFFVDLVCHDSAEGEPRYYWDREHDRSSRVSPRCELSEAEARRVVRFHPKVDFSVSPGPRGFRLFGSFQRGSYQLTLSAGASTVAGGVLMETFRERFEVPARSPQLSFAASGRYLPASAWKSLAVRHVNVEQAELTVRQVPPENLVFWMSHPDSEAADERTSNLVVKKKLSLKGAPDQLTTTWVDMASLLPASTRGVLELRLAAGSANAVARLLITDLNLVAKRTQSSAAKSNDPEVLVWALSMTTGEPISGVEVTLVRKSGHVVSRCTMAGMQGCRLSGNADDLDPEKPFALIARKDNELTYLKYDELKTDLSESAVSGEPYFSQVPYRAALYTDRGVYRPGETAHVSAVVRERSQKAPPGGMPVELRVFDPRNKLFKKQVQPTNEAGLVSVDVAFADYADTGRYRVELAVADKAAGEAFFNVEEFVPERMKVQLVPTRPALGMDDPAEVAVEAKYLFGGTPDGSPVELSCALEPSEFKPRQNANFHYGVRRDRVTPPRVLGQVKGTLNAEGRALLSCPPLRQGGQVVGPTRLTVQAAVFEAGSGRSTQAQLALPVHPEFFYLGLRSGAQRLESGKAATVEGLVVDWNGAPSAKAPSQVTVELFRLETEYGHWWSNEEGEETAERHRRAVSEGSQVAQVENGRFKLTLTPTSAAEAYLIRASAGNARTELEVDGAGSSYWWGDEQRVDRTPRPMKPTSLEVVLPERAAVGTAHVAKVVAPFAGWMLFTLETDRVLAAEWKKVDAGEVSWGFQVEKFTPNVYVSAFLVKDPHLESKEAFLPDRAFGVTSVAVEPKELELTVQLDAPAEVRSNRPLEVVLDVGPQEGPTYATVAVVDEGVLSLTRFQSPSPLQTLLRRRQLGVETFETVGWAMLSPPQGSSSHTGGDGEGGGGAPGRVQPVKPVALWSGVVPVPASGKTQVRFDIPQYRGAVRVMAVVVGPKRIGAASRTVTVRDPLVLQATMPRFLTQGDEVQIPVFLTNVSGKAMEVKVQLQAEPLAAPGTHLHPEAVSPLKLLGKSEGEVRLEDGKAATLVFQAAAVQASGAARLTVRARFGDLEVREALEVPFIPAGPRERRVQRLELQEGELDLKPLLSGWEPNTERTTAWVTTNPYGESFDHLKYLLHYPYGCIEQTTSSTRPLLFVSSFIGDVDPALTASNKVEDMVMAGVNRVFSMQTPAGGFAYWPGSTEPNAWGTAYATHMLLDAQKLGYAVPGERLQQALSWLEGRVLNPSREDSGDRWGHFRGNPEAYAHYVLALAQKGHKAQVQALINRLPAKLDGEGQETAYLLKAALFLAGDRRYERDLRNPDLSALSDERRTGGSYYSDRRRRGFVLNVFSDLFGDDSAGEPLAQLVADSLRGKASHWYTTQELVWGITGLGKRLGKTSERFAPPQLVAAGKAVEPKAPGRAGSGSRAWSLARASEYGAVSLKVPEKGEGKLFLVLSSEGVRTQPTVAYGGEGLRLQRTYRNAKGEAIDPLREPQALAELAFVELTVTNLRPERTENLALVDRLPAGWEIENPRLGRAQPLDWVDADALWDADAMNVRDDRLEVFGALKAGESRTVVYAVRAVTSGSFTVPPAEVEAMYDPRIWARQPGGRMTIRGPWKDHLL